MKFYIGKYPRTWIFSKLERNYLKKKYKIAYVTKDSEGDVYRKIFSALDTVIQFILDNTTNLVLSKRDGSRKVKASFTRSDFISLDDTIATILHRLFVEFEKMNPPYFTVSDLDDFPVDIDNDKERYKWLLKELIWTFEYLSSDEKYEFDLTKLERANNGLRLFAKYFHNFWI